MPHPAKLLLPLVAIPVLSYYASPIQAQSDPQALVEPDVAHVPFALAELQRRTFDYFWDTATPDKGLVPDRWPKRTFSSIAATGFGLTSYLIGVEKGYITRDEAIERVLKTLRSHWELPQSDRPTEVSGYRGFFYHFLDFETGHRFQQVELSTIDTTLFVAGALSCQSYFDRHDPREAEIRELAEKLYRRIEWDWALNRDGRVSMGWHPEKGFIRADWKGYNEAMLLYLLAIASPTHPVPVECWDRWCETYQWKEFHGQEYINFAPLFGHQYSHMYVDFRGLHDKFTRGKGIDYFENSRRATLAQRAYAMDNPRQFRGYGPNCWGLTACDGPENAQREWRGESLQIRTYAARGAAATVVRDDGTIAPTAAGGSVPFAPEACLAALEHMWNTYPELVGQFGFHDAMNLTFGFDPSSERGWFDSDYLGIDQGPILIQTMNYETGFVWELMKKNPHVQRGLMRVFAP